MHRAVARPWLTLATILSLALVTLSTVDLAQAAPARQGGTAVSISPAQSDLTCGETVSVDVRITDVEDLFGVDIKVGFDANVVEVVDAIPAQAGINVQPGDLPDATNGQGLIQINNVDEAGIISYAATRLNPNPAQSGSGVIINITFRGLAAGNSDINLESVILSDDTARPIPADTTGGSIAVTCDGSTPVPTEPGEPTAVPTSPGDPTPRPTVVPGDGKTCTHVVKLGETLYSIARYYGVSVNALAAANGISNPNFIYSGQQLRIPGCGGTGQPDTPGKPTDPGKPNQGCSTHVVKPGETLFGIAYAYGDSVAGLAQRNGIANPNLVWAGQRLTACRGGSGGYVPGKPADPGWGKPLPGKPGMGGACRYTHVVKPGETLFSIAYRYGVSVYAVQAASGLANPNLIYSGQALCIP